MRLENTDRFRNRYCEVVFKDKHAETGFIMYVPNYSDKYNYHAIGWFLRPHKTSDSSEDIELKFKDINEITVLW